MKLSRIIHNSAALVSLDILTKAMPLLVFPWMVRALGPAAYGKVGFAAAIAGFFGLLASPGFSTYMLREAAKEPGRVGFLIENVVGARIVFATGAYALLTVFVFTFAPRDWTTRVLILLAGLAFVVGSLDTQWIFLARSRMWMIALRGAVGQLVYAAIILGFVRQPSDAWMVPAASFASLVLAALLVWMRARSEYRIPQPAFSPKMWKGFLPVCLIMGCASMMSMIYDQIDTVMLRYMGGEAELGSYVASYRLMAMAMSFVPILGQVFFPLLSESSGQNPESEQRYLRWLGQASIGLALPIAAGGFILAEPLTRFALGTQYAGAGLLFRWLTLTIVAGPLASYFGAQLIPARREKKYLLAVAAGAAVNVVLNLLLIPRFGAIAAAFTTAISQGVVAAMNYRFVRDLPRPSLIKGLGLSVAATSLMVVVLHTLRSAFPLHVVVLVVLGAVFYGSSYLGSRLVWNRWQMQSS
jgi:O-antigen/teichoic acid export membrane protein